MTAQTEQRVIAGRYALEDTLGKGGMGVVWRATDRLLRRAVAIKEISFPVTLGGDELEALKERVLREARTAARLNHQAAVSVYDVVQDDGRAFIIMELVDAPTLADLVRSEGPLRPELAATVGLHVLDALAAAHAKGIVHRDVKPGNVMVPSEGSVKLADFGIASVKDDPRLTASGMILGSPAFMSPEQAQENRSTPATDIWALGATLFFAVSGTAPFDRGQPIPTLTAVLHDEPEIDARAGALEPVIRACLEKDEERRPRADVLRTMLEAVISGDAGTVPLSTGATMVPTEVVSTPQPVATGTPAEPLPAQTSVRRTPGPLTSRAGLLLALVGLATVAIVAFVLLRGGGDEAGRPEAIKGSGGGNSQQNDEPADDPVVVPEEWTSYQDETVGYTIAYPEGWSIESGPTSTITDFRDPETGTYMRVDWTNTPGPSVVDGLAAQSATFGGSHADYEEIRIEPVSFVGDEAGEWEYTYSEDGASLHAVNLQFTTEEYGFALNFQAHEADWAAMQETFEAFKASFKMP